MNPTLQASITKEEADGLRRVAAVLVAIDAGHDVPFCTTNYKKWGLVSYVPGLNGPVMCGQQTKRTAGHWCVTEKGRALIRNA
jgi:hypothetical protein